ncbi:MAG: hypothetical protein NVSMB51_12090 [Solirubrobacteraceae bacterium]
MFRRQTSPSTAARSRRLLLAAGLATLACTSAGPPASALPGAPPPCGEAMLNPYCPSTTTPPRTAKRHCVKHKRIHGVKRCVKYRPRKAA